MNVKLEVYPTYAKRLNFLIAEHPEKSYLWNDVVRRAAQLMREDNGELNAYPQKAQGLKSDLETRAALVHLARASERARWAFLSMAARDVLKRESGVP